MKLSIKMLRKKKKMSYPKQNKKTLRENPHHEKMDQFHKEAPAPKRKNPLRPKILKKSCATKKYFVVAREKKKRAVISGCSSGTNALFFLLLRFV